MQSRPLKILVSDTGITKTYIVLEKLCSVCGGTGLEFPDLVANSPPCDHCSGGYAPTEVGEVILRLVVAHLTTPTQYGGVLRSVALRNLFRVTQGE